MTITVNTIEGRRGSACNNNAFSVVAEKQDGSPDVLAIIPASDIPNRSSGDVKAAFGAAAKISAERDQIITIGRRALGLETRAPKVA